LTPSKPSACVRGDHTSSFYRFTPTLSRKSVCDQLLIRNILVLLFSFEVPLKKIIKKSCKKAKRNETKKSNNKEGALCVFSIPFYGGAL
jgi:hypothetical protein